MHPSKKLVPAHSEIFIQIFLELMTIKGSVSIGSKGQIELINFESWVLKFKPFWRRMERNLKIVTGIK